MSYLDDAVLFIRCERLVFILSALYKVVTVVYADYSNQLTTVGDNFDNQSFMIVLLL